MCRMINALYALLLVIPLFVLPAWGDQPSVSITLDRIIHFTAPDGGDIQVDPGNYELESGSQRPTLRRDRRGICRRLAEKHRHLLAKNLALQPEGHRSRGTNFDVHANWPGLTTQSGWADRIDVHIGPRTTAADQPYQSSKYLDWLVPNFLRAAETGMVFSINDH